MATPINTIYSWFETGDFPTQEQFQASWSSFWHKEEKIPMSSIDGLSQQFGNFVLDSTFKSHLSDQNAHPYFAKKDASNIKEYVANWRAALEIENLKIGLVDNGDLSNGVELPLQITQTLAFNNDQFDYETNEENNTLFLKIKESKTDLKGVLEKGSTVNLPETVLDVNTNNFILNQGAKSTLSGQSQFSVTSNSILNLDNAANVTIEKGSKIEMTNGGIIEANNGGKVIAGSNGAFLGQSQYLSMNADNWFKVSSMGANILFHNKEINLSSDSVSLNLTPSGLKVKTNASYYTLPAERGLEGQSLMIDAEGVVHWNTSTLEQARQNGNVIEGDIELSEFKKIFNNGNYNGFLYFDDGTPVLGFTTEEGKRNILTYNESQLGIISDVSDFKGIVGNLEFNKQGDRKAFAQLSDVYDSNNLEKVMQRGNGTTKNIIFEPSQGIAGQIGFSKTTYSYYFGDMNPAHTGTYNQSFGYNALAKLTTGDGNNAFGFNALGELTTGYQNAAFGTGAGGKITSGTFNTAFGFAALGKTTTGYKNNAFGYESGPNNTTGKLNNFLGSSAGQGNSTGSLNNYIGVFSGQGVNGNNNVMIGTGAGVNGGNVNNKLVIHGNTTLSGFGSAPNEYGTFGNINESNLSNALIVGDFLEKWIKFNGSFSINPTKMPVANNSYTKNLVADPLTGTFGWEDKITVPKPPTEGSFVLKSLNGVMSWVAE